MKHAPISSSADIATVEVASGASRLCRTLNASDRAAASAYISEWTANTPKQSRQGIDLTAADLPSVDLAGLDLRGVKLNRAILHAARLDNADLSGAYLICLRTEKASLWGTTLHGTCLHGLAAQVCDFKFLRRAVNACKLATI